MSGSFRVSLKPYLPACPHRDSGRKLAGGVCLTRSFLSPWARVGVFKTTSSSWGCRCFFLFLHSVSFSEALGLTTSESDSPALCRTLGSGHFQKPVLGRMQTAAALMRSSAGGTARAATDESRPDERASRTLERQTQCLALLKRCYLSHALPACTELSFRWNSTRKCSLTLALCSLFLSGWPVCGLTLPCLNAV